MPVSPDQMLAWCRSLLGAGPAAKLSLEQYLEAIPRLSSLAAVPSGTAVLIRGDLDAKPGPEIGEGDERLRSMLETLSYGRERGWKQVLVGHVGRKPEGSLKSVGRRLEELLKCPVELIGDWLDESGPTILDAAAQQIQAADAGSVFLLENARKYKIERVLWDATPDDLPALAGPLAVLANQFAEKIAVHYVNEALSAGSLDASSTVAPAGMQRVALGAYVAREFDGPMLRCRQARLVVFSGLKIDKLDDLQAIIGRGAVQVIMAAGSLAMALKKADAQLAGGDFHLGLAEDPAHADKPYYIPPDRVEQARRMLADGRARGIEFVLPVDFILADGQASEAIGPGKQQFDVGPRTCQLLSTRVDDFIAAHTEKTGGEKTVVFHNGVLGMFEDARFENGTKHFMTLLQRMTVAGLEVYVGGGEGGAALERYGRPDWVTHCFTAGGTVLNALGGQPVPYLVALKMAMEGECRRTKDE